MGHYPELISPSSYESRYSCFGKVMIILKKIIKSSKLMKDGGELLGIWESLELNKS